MSKIDLSKAKIGDKFRTRDGLVLTYDKEFENPGIHILNKESGMSYLFLENGNYMVGGENHQLDLVEQVFDDEKDTTDREIVEAMNKAIKEIPKQAAEREKELQRRQEVVELAERLLFMNRMHDAYNDYIEALNKEDLHTLISFPSYILQCAEDFIKYKNQYLKDGKL